MRDFLKKIVSKIDLHSKRTKIIFVVAIILIALFFVGRYFYNKYHVSDYSEITILVNNREYELAEQKLEGLLKEDARDPYFLILVARTYIGRSDEVSVANQRSEYLNKALQVLNNTVEINPNISEIYSMKGLVYLYLGEYRNAETFYRKALVISPESVDILIDLGNLYLTSNNIAAGFDVFGEVLKKDPANENAKIGLAKLYMLQNKYENALNVAVTLFNASTSQITKLQLAEILGSAYLRLNKYSEAKKFFEYILSNNPKSGFATYGLAEVSFAKSFNIKDISGSTLEAKQLALKSVEINPLYPYNYILLTRIAHLTKDKVGYDKYYALAKESVSTYSFLSSKEKSDLLLSIPRFGATNSSVKIKQFSITSISTTTPPSGMVIIKK